jgi:ferric-dicitrate binding protein FerR (iron transport regulator)
MNKQIEKYFGGEPDINERIELLEKIKSDKVLQAEFTTYQNTLALFSFSDSVTDTADTERGYRSFLRTVRRKHVRRIVLKAVGYAAAIVLLIVSVHLYDVYTTPSVTPEVITETSLFVPAGQRVSVRLQDGTVVWLNAQTRLTYPTVFSKGERRVSVEGEAWFEVAKDPDKPFIVSSKGVDMKVLGTTFNVYSYPSENYSRISLMEGSLQVCFPASKAGVITLKPNEQVTVQEHQMRVGKITHPDYFLWRNGIYSFQKELLIDVLKKLELYYDVKIKVEDPSIYQWEYTGKFRQRDGIDEIIRVIRKIHKFKVEKDEENNIITLR